MQCIVVKYLHIKHTEKNALCYFKHSQILRFGKKLITAHCCFDVSKLMTRTRTCGVLQEVLKPYLVYDPKPKVMYMGHIRPTGKPSRGCHRIHQPPIKQASPNCSSQLAVSNAIRRRVNGQGSPGESKRAGQGCIEYTAVLYLSKFSSGLLLLHSSMCYEVVKHLPCGEKRRTWQII